MRRQRPAPAGRGAGNGSLSFPGAGLRFLPTLLPRPGGRLGFTFPGTLGGIPSHPAPLILGRGERRATCVRRAWIQRPGRPQKVLTSACAAPANLQTLPPVFLSLFFFFFQPVLGWGGRFSNNSHRSPRKATLGYARVPLYKGGSVSILLCSSACIHAEHCRKTVLVAGCGIESPFNSLVFRKTFSGVRGIMT